MNASESPHRAWLERLSPSLEDPEFVPGSRAHDLPPARPEGEAAPPDDDVTELLAELDEWATTEGSAAGRARARLVSSELLGRLGRHEEAFSNAEKASQESPQLTLAHLGSRRFAPPDFDPEPGLEKAVRLGRHPATRIHATLLLARLLAARGEGERAEALLDHAAHGGTGDVRVKLARLLARLAMGKTGSELEIPETWRRSVARVVELFGGLATSEEPHLSLRLLRVARALASGDPEKATEELELAGRDALTELAATFLLDLPEARERGAARLRELEDVAPSAARRRLLLDSALARRALDEARALAASTPDSYSTVERLVLAALTQSEPPRPAPEELEALHPTWRALLDEESRSPHARVALAFTRLAQDPDALPRALELLEDETLLARLVTLDRSARDLPLFLTTLESLQAEHGARGLALIAGWCAEDAGDTERARAQFERALEEPSLGLAAWRGLTRLDPNADPSPWRGALRGEDEALGADLDLEIALRSSGADRLEALERSSQLWSEPFLRLLLSLHAEGQGEEARAESALSLLAESGDPALSAFARVRALLERAHRDPAAAARAWLELGPTLPAPDPSLAWLAYEWATSAQELTLPLPDSTWALAERASARLARGELEAARPALRDLISLTRDPLAASLERSLEERLGEVTRASEFWMSEAKTEEPSSRRRAYERLAELDARRGDVGDAILWLRALAEEFPDDPGPLLFLEGALFERGLVDEWAHVRDRLAQLLPLDDARAYALVAGALELGRLDVRAAHRHLAPLGSAEPPSLLALQVARLRAIEKRDDEELLGVVSLLAARATSPLDRESLTLELACLHARAGHLEEARDAAKKAAALRPDSLVARLLVARLEAREGRELRGEDFRELAERAVAPHHRAQFWLEAGLVFEREERKEEAAFAFERTLEVDPSHTRAFLGLSEILEERGDRPALARLLTERLTLADDKAERLELELRLAELALELEDKTGARRHLESALALEPQELRALRAHATLCTELGDPRAAERSLVALRDRLPDDAERLAVLRSLGFLYEELDVQEKAMDAYEAVLARDPEDREVAGRLVQVLARLGLGERATALETRLIQSTTSDDDKRRGALVLADLYERVVRDPARAGATLERARKAWPLDAEVLVAQAHFLERQGDGATRRFLVDRTGKDVLRALDGGKIEAGLLETLARAAELSDVPSQAETARAARAAFLGEDDTLPGAGTRALAVELDELLSPPELSAPLRRLLEKTGAALDAAFAVDLSALGAARLQEGPVLERLGEMTRSLGANAPEVYVASSLGSRCLPCALSPLRFAVGPGLAELPEPSRDYVLLRALSLAKMGAGALARSQPDDTSALLAALLLLFVPTWQPRGVDARKVAQSRALLEHALGRVGYDDDVPTLALETIGAMGNHEVDWGEAVRRAARRRALLGVGAPSAALEAVAVGSDRPLPARGPARFRWIESHPEARELLLFSVSDALALARERLGLAPARAARGPVPPPPRR